MRSPFLLETLEASPGQESPAELAERLASLASRLVRPARRHVERALVRQLADAGERDPRALARAVTSLRRATADPAAVEAEALEVVEEELFPPAEGKCECGRCHDAAAGEEGFEAGDAYEADEVDEDEEDEAGDSFERYEAAEGEESEYAEDTYESDEADGVVAEETDAGSEEEDQVPRRRTRPTPAVAKGVTLKPHLAGIKGELFSVDASEGSQTAIFVPAAVKKTGTFSALVWIHGDPVCGDGPAALGHVQSATIPMARMLADSKRAFVLIAPTMGWWRRRDEHPLGTPRTMNAFLLEEVCKSLVGAGWAAAPTIDRLILAGHSHAYAVFYGLAEAADDPESWKNPLAKLTDVWWLDATYGKRHSHTFSRKLTFWAAFKRSVNFSVLYIPGSDTSKVAELVELKVKAAQIKMDIKALPRDGDEKTDDHCLMPQRQLGALLTSAK